MKFILLCLTVILVVSCKDTPSTYEGKGVVLEYIYAGESHYRNLIIKMPDNTRFVARWYDDRGNYDYHDKLDALVVGDTVDVYNHDGHLRLFK